MTDKSAEDLRVKAESGRVEAEQGRVVAESNEESGRVEAEKGRVGAELLRETSHDAAVANAERSQKEFDAQIEALRDDPAHYMTPGARRYFRRVAIGYLILAIGTSFGIKALTERTDDAVRNDINEIAKAQCLGSIPTLNKYNSLVQIQIEANRDSREIALKEGDIPRVRLTTKNIIKLQDAFLRVPSAKECEAPILK